MRPTITHRRTAPLAAPLLGALVALGAPAGCASDGGGEGPDCSGLKCDIPEGEDADLCALRREDAFNENQIAFTREFLRWSCNDVPGVTGADRGQEYCEYFAIAQLPPASADAEPPPPAVLGRNLGPDYTHGTTPVSLELTYEQIVALESDPTAVVGQCVFTSWNSDIPGPVPACDEAGCPEVLGVPVAEEDFRMKFDVNSMEAGKLLVEDCWVADRAGEEDDFTRGCMLNAEINDTAFRKSDTTVCAATVRLAECGCEPTGPTGFSELISPEERRGFPLGTWSSVAELPAGCHFVDLGDGSQTVVTCDLAAGDVLDYALDLKARCQTLYADNVVVHVPMPAEDGVRCAPEASSSPYAGTCTATPWLLQPY
ncbi:MAG TPA: hypothetical protein VKZ63_03995 [Kofleriaceae bacterium]|nr:hypothetical protein [Kofleriaceae bacterium]